MNEELLSQKGIVEKYLKKKKHVLSSFSFASIFLWQDFFNFDFKTVDNNLCVFAAHGPGEFLYLPPLGEAISQKAIDYCFERMRRVNLGGSLTRIENAEEKESWDPARYQISRKYDEYVYKTSDIAGLKGNLYKSKRSAYNQFLKGNNAFFIGYNQELRRECLNLYDNWAKERKKDNRDEVYLEMLKENRIVHDLVFQFHDTLGLVGRVVVVNKKIEGYTFGYELNDETFCSLLEVANLEINGLATFIFCEFAREFAEKYKFINAMDDFGMKNIRTAKMSFHPCTLVPAYIVKENE